MFDPFWKMRPVAYTTYNCGVIESVYVFLVKMPQKKLRAAVEGFRGRIERVIVAEGWHIEN